jgi:hypothetical protein
LKESIGSGLLETLESNENADLARWALVFHRKQWPEDINSKLIFGDNDDRKMSLRLQLNERDTVHAFRDCLIEKTVLEKLKHLRSTLSTIPILSSECERGFS